MRVYDKARRFAELHVKGSPLVLYNVWNASSARAVVQAGSDAVGTSSWAVAHALGYESGERISKALVEEIVAGIAEAVTVPITVDFEGGYSEDYDQLTVNVERLLHFGVVGIDFEDRVVRGSGLYSVSRQAKRIAAVRRAADRKGVQLFINVQTGLFLQAGHDGANLLDEALTRAKAYADAGASGFCIPGAQEEATIANICERVGLPVNVIDEEGATSIGRLSRLGVARISYGKVPYLKHLAMLRKQAAMCLDNQRPKEADAAGACRQPRLSRSWLGPRWTAFNDNADDTANVGSAPGPS